MNPQVVKIAWQARRWAEKVAVLESFPPDLCGLCGRASGKLFYELALAGFRPQLHSTGAHVYLTLDDNIIDITATQFKDTRGQKVFIMPMKDVPRGWWQYIEPKQSFHELKKFQVYQTKSGWHPPCVLVESDLCPFNQST